MTAKRLPLVPSTVTINGKVHGARSIVWAGLRWHEAVRSHFDQTLLPVPYHHPDEACWDGGWRVVSPRYPGWRFVQCRSGAWMLEMSE